jgi:hypothetical protein
LNKAIIKEQGERNRKQNVDLQALRLRVEPPPQADCFSQFHPGTEKVKNPINPVNPACPVECEAYSTGV